MTCRTAEGAEIELGGLTVPIAADAELVEVGVGPVLLQGTIREWLKVLDREAGALFDLAELPAPPPPATSAFTGVTGGARQGPTRSWPA